MNNTGPSVEPTALPLPWHVVEDDDDVCAIEFDGGVRRTMGISGANQFAEMIEERALRVDPPVLVVAIGILHAELREVLEMANGRPIGDWAPWLRAIVGLENYPSATIVAVPDQATCGGLELSLAADIRIAAPTASLGVLETRMGLIPGAGGTQRLPRLVGPANAALLCFLGESVSGVEAHRMGLVQLLDDDPVNCALVLARRMSQRGSAVLRAAKRAVIAARPSNEDGFRTEGKGFLDVVGRDESKATMSEWIRRQDAGDPPSRDPSWLA